MDTRGRLLTALGYGLWPSMVLLSEIVQTFILADFCYYYVKRWVLSINLLYTVKVPNLKFQAILYNVILLQPYWWTTCSATSIWSGMNLMVKFTKWVNWDIEQLEVGYAFALLFSSLTSLILDTLYTFFLLAAIELC